MRELTEEETLVVAGADGGQLLPNGKQAHPNNGWGNGEEFGPGIPGGSVETGKFDTNGNRSDYLTGR